MALRYGDRQQKMLFPASIEEYIEAEAPVRAYDAFIEALDFAALGIEIDPKKVGCPQYDPKAMLKLLVYGYSYGWRSSRKLEREVHYNLSFIWLTGGLKPDHKTIAEFRRRNKKGLSRVLQQCARLCIRLDLIEGNTLFVDGSKMRANASIRHSWTAERARKALPQIDARIEALLTECEQADQAEQDQGSLVRMKEELKDQAVLKAQVLSALEQLQSEQKSSVNTTDADCVRIHGLQGSHAGYNSQIVTDDRHGLIVHSEVVGANNDLGQFADQIESAHQVLDEPCENACGDAGYADADDLERLDRQGIKVIVPSNRQASAASPGPFDKSQFHYDAEQDCYRCPQGYVLPCRSTEKKRRRKYYMAGGSVCHRCCHFGVCTTDRSNGRRITRYFNEPLREKLQKQYEQPESREIFRRRKYKAEPPFGHIKRNLKADHFLLRGLAGVQAEMSLLSSCFNIARLISLLGVSGLRARLSY
jgi:transposase